MLFRMFFFMVLYVLGARWIYAEAKLAMPGAIPYIDSFLEAVAVPTHDKWETDAIMKYALERLEENVGELKKVEADKEQASSKPKSSSLVRQEKDRRY